MTGKWCLFLGREGTAAGCCGEERGGEGGGKDRDLHNGASSKPEPRQDGSSKPEPRQDGVGMQTPGGFILGRKRATPRGATLCHLLSHFLPFVWVCKLRAGRGYICHRIPRA